MATYHVEFQSPSQATFLVGKRPLATVRLDEVCRVYEVFAGWDAYATDHEFWIIELCDRIIVVPDDTEGAAELIRRWRPAQEAKDAVQSASCAETPKAWRRRVLGLLPSVKPKLIVVDGCVDEQQIPAWKLG